MAARDDYPGLAAQALEPQAHGWAQYVGLGYRLEATRALDEIDQLRAEIAKRGTDPLYPTLPLNVWRNWIDFTERGALPLVDADEEAAEQSAMADFRKANPHYLAACMAIALGTVRRHEATARAAIDHLRALAQECKFTHDGGTVCLHGFRECPHRAALQWLSEVGE